MPDDAEAMRKPDFFLVGAPKCGTTAMTDYLRQHPDIFIPQVKELQFFARDIGLIPTLGRNPEWFGMTEERYVSFFSGATVEKRIGDSSVLYLYSASAPAEISKFNPSADIIVMVRNPVEMMYSLHSQNLYVLNEDLEDFGEALAAEADRMGGRKIPETAFWPGGLLYREVAKVSGHIENYLNVFGRERVHVIVYDDLRDDPYAAYSSTLAFLGVDESFRPEFARVNPNKRLRSRTLYSFLSSPPRPFKALAGAMARVEAARAVARWALRRLNAAYEPRKPMDPELRKRLTEELAPEVERLGKLLERDLSHWLELSPER